MMIIAYRNYIRKYYYSNKQITNCVPNITTSQHGNIVTF